MNGQMVFPSAPVDDEATADVVDAVARDWRSDLDWRRFVFACLMAAAGSDDSLTVHVGVVRRRLTNAHGLMIAPRRLSAFWNRAASNAGFLDFAGWEINDDVAGRNAGRPQRVYRVRPPMISGVSATCVLVSGAPGTNNQ